MGHVLLGAGVAVSLSAPDAESASPPDTLIVTLVSREPEPTSEAEAEAALQEEPAPTLDVASRIASQPLPSLALPSLATPLAELEVLSAPNSTLEAPPLPASVRQALARASGCADAAPARRNEPPAGCPPISDRLALAGPSGRAYLDETLLEQGGAVTALKLAAAYIASSMVDATIFDGRGGDLATPVTTWEINARMNPLTVDQRIFDPETGEVTILRQAGEP